MLISVQHFFFFKKVIFKMEDLLDTANGKSTLKYFWDVKKIKQCNTDQNESVTTTLRK